MAHYYQVRIIPHPQDNHWSLEAVDSMLQATTGLPDNPTPLLPNQPPDPLTAIVSGRQAPGTQATPSTVSGGGRGAAGRTPGRGQRRGDSTSTAGSRWRPSRSRRQKTPTEPNLCPIFAVHQIRALALGGQLQPAIRTETEARAAHAALVHEIFSALRSALERLAGNPPGP